MADPPPRPRMGMLTILLIAAVFLIMFIPEYRMIVGQATGFLLDPVIGFGNRYPVLTILLAGLITTVATTVLRHFTTDWLEMAKVNAYMRHYQAERVKAMKENNTYKQKVLKDKEGDVQAMRARMTTQTFKQMPATMLIAMPVFTWLFLYLGRLDYVSFATPWNPEVNLFTTEGILWGSSVFQHWILLSIVLTIPFGLLVQRIMKYWAWRERWQKRHPGVHE